MISEIIEKQRRDPQVLIENKISFAAANSELSIYDTFEPASRVELASDQLMFCGMVSGKKVMHANDNNFECEFLPHESFVMAPNHPVEIDFPIASIEHPTTCLAIEIGSQRVQQIISGLNSTASLAMYEKEWQYDNELIHTHHNSQTQALLHRIVQIYTENHQDRSFLIDLAVTELIVRLLRHQTREFIISHCNAQPDHNGLNAVVFYIQENLADNLDFEQLCKLACMSRTKFFNVFKQAFGCTPTDFLFQVRLKRAAQLLLSGETITTVCFATGYKNSSHFSRSFKAFYGMSPRQYQHQQMHSINHEADK
ncbi:MAG: AraC family transcriptional regulator [Oceanospirillaceae bacterium]|nr:AraC family transcriptional regulator [Oceanospirillaceae bacterium]